MRLVHIADVHAGMVTHSRTDPATGLPSRLLDVARCLDAAIDVAIERRVDAVILAGDTWHHASPDAAAINVVAASLRRLQEEDIPVVLLAGNHDRSGHPGQRSIVEAFERRDSRAHVRAVTRPDILDIGGLLVACLPSVSRHHLMASRPELSRLEADEHLVEGLQRVLDNLRLSEADVLVGHWPVAGSLIGAEKDIALIPEPMLSPEDLQGPWSYLAMGHIHRAQELRLRERIIGAYSGSIDRMNFGEEGEPKVALEVELSEDGPPIPTRHELPARRFLTYDVAGREHLELVASDVWCWDDELEGAVEDAIVRVRIEATEEQARRVDVGVIRASLLDAGAHQAHVELTVHRSARPRAEQVAGASGPLEALEGFLDAREIDETHRPPIRRSATELLEEAAS